MYGEMDLERMTAGLGYEMPARLLGPLLLWVYMFISTIVLVNLLIAQMSDAYNRVTSAGLLRWHYQRAAFVLEYKDMKMALPPPLTLFSPPIAFVRRCVSSTEHTMGYQFLPPQSQLLRLERLERSYLHKALQAARDAKETAVDSKINQLASQLSFEAELSSSRFEKLNGRLDKLAKLFEGGRGDSVGTPSSEVQV
jgi:hypothetical protein